MNTMIKDTIFGFLVICFIAVLAWFVWNSKNKLETAVQETIVPDSVAVTKPSIRYAKKIATIDAVTVFELVRTDYTKIYVTVSNAPGVSASVTIE